MYVPRATKTLSTVCLDCAYVPAEFKTVRISGDESLGMNEFIPTHSKIHPHQIRGSAAVGVNLGDELESQVLTYVHHKTATRKYI